MSDVDWSAIPGAVVKLADVPAVPRVISGADFLALWKPAEVAAGEQADPRLLYASRRAMAQNSVNLDSPELTTLLQLAVTKGVLTKERAAQIAAGQPAP